MSDATYTTLSEISISDLAEYLHLTEVDSSQVQLLTTIIEAARNYIVSETGQALSALDNYPDITLAAYALAQDMYDNRAIYVDKANISETVSTILGLYRINLL